jgi:hypothetical protein
VPFRYGRFSFFCRVPEMANRRYAANKICLPCQDLEQVICRAGQPGPAALVFGMLVRVTNRCSERHPGTDGGSIVRRPFFPLLPRGQIPPERQFQGVSDIS